MFSKKTATTAIEIKEPASGNYIGIAQVGEKVFFPDVSSCLIILFKMDDGKIIGGHVPMMWGNNHSFELFQNAQKVLSEMLNLSGSARAINSLFFIGDESNWNDPESPFETNLVKILLEKFSLDTKPYHFFDKEKISNANVSAKNNLIKIIDNKSKKKFTFSLERFTSEKNNAPHSKM